MEVLPAIIVAGVLFAGTQLLISTFNGPWTAGLLSAIVTLAGLWLFFRVWKPRRAWDFPGAAGKSGGSSATVRAGCRPCRRLPPLPRPRWLGLRTVHPARLGAVPPHVPSRAPLGGRPCQARAAAPGHLVCLAAAGRPHSARSARGAERDSLQGRLFVCHLFSTRHCHLHCQAFFRCSSCRAWGRGRVSRAWAEP